MGAQLDFELDDRIVVGPGQISGFGSFYCRKQSVV
jgi:hypothetical protein